MSRSFLLNGNYFETITDVTSWGDGRIAVPKRPDQHHTWDGSAWVPATPAWTNEDVNAERNLRILSGKMFSLTGYGSTVRVGGDSQTQTNLMALGLAAQARMAQGDFTTLTPYRDEDNLIHQLTPAQVFELWSLGAAFVSLVYQASWAIKDDPNGLPADISGDARWPA